MSQPRVLSIGTTPGVGFLAWQLWWSVQAKVTVLDGTVADRSAEWTTPQGTFQFVPTNRFQAVNELISRQEVFDIVLVSISSLQDMNRVSEMLRAVVSSCLTKNSYLVIESTHCVRLENLFEQSFPSIPIISVMLEGDVRRLHPVRFSYVQNSDTVNLHIGSTCGSQPQISSQKKDQIQFAIEDFETLVSKFSTGSVNSYDNALSLLQKQWDMAIPVIVFEFLSIIFECCKASELVQLILAKPLITGLIIELLAISRAMGCDTMKVPEYEKKIVTDFLSNAAIPSTKTKQKLAYMESNASFYNFYHRLPINVDTVLLQPILLGDDYGQKTPYLEFLYAVISQYTVINTNPEKSVLFSRKTANSPSASSDALYNANGVKQLRQTTVGQPPVVPKSNTPDLKELAELAEYGAAYDHAMHSPSYKSSSSASSASDPLQPNTGSTLKPGISPHGSGSPSSMQLRTDKENELLRREELIYAKEIELGLRKAPYGANSSPKSGLGVAAPDIPFAQPPPIGGGNYLGHQSRPSSASSLSLSMPMNGVGLPNNVPVRHRSSKSGAVPYGSRSQRSNSRPVLMLDEDEGIPGVPSTPRVAPEQVGNIDMMSFTQRRNRRTMSSKSRSYSDLLALSGTPAPVTPTSPVAQSTTIPQRSKFPGSNMDNPIASPPQNYSGQPRHASYSNAGRSNGYPYPSEQYPAPARNAGIPRVSSRARPAEIPRSNTMVLGNSGGFSQFNEGPRAGAGVQANGYEFGQQNQQNPAMGRPVNSSNPSNGNNQSNRYYNPLSPRNNDASGTAANDRTTSNVIQLGNTTVESAVVDDSQQSIRSVAPTNTTSSSAVASDKTGKESSKKSSRGFLGFGRRKTKSKK